MTVFSFDHGDMTTAATSASDAATSARGADSSAACSAIASALPGTTTADVLP